VATSGENEHGPVSASDQIRFDSLEIEPGTRFARYRELYSAGADAIELGPDFLAQMTASNLDGSILYTRTLKDVGHERSQVRCRRDGMDHFTLTMTIVGGFHVDSGDGFACLHPGEAVLLDTTQPMRNRAVDAHIITMSLARDRVAAASGMDVGSLHGRHIDPRQGLLLFDHVRSLAKNAHRLPESHLIPLSNVTDILLGLSLDHGVSGAPPRSLAATARFKDIASFVERHLGDPCFEIDAVLARFPLSRATLYRVFQPHGGFARYVLHQRVRLLRRRLLADDVVSLDQLATSVGLKSEGRASDAFLAEFGLRPGRYRHQARAETRLERARRQMAEWTSDLS
jgi:AraC-like DNA-binding protein